MLKELTDICDLEYAKYWLIEKEPCWYEIINATDEIKIKDDVIYVKNNISGEMCAWWGGYELLKDLSLYKFIKDKPEEFKVTIDIMNKFKKCI